MTATTSLPRLSDRDEQLGAAIFDCLQALEAGQTPEQLLARYPEFASELREFFADRRSMERWAAPLRGTTPPPPTDSSVADTIAESGRFGDFQIVREIGRGGMGVVYEARQTRLNRTVALKMVQAGRLAGPVDFERFRAEAAAAAHLDHPHIVPLYEVGEHDGRPFFSMKLIEGGNLAEKSGARKQESGVSKAEQREAARTIATIARAVHYAHQRGVLHRDLKPSNILLDSNGQPYVSDFGLAKRVEGENGLTQSGVILGTPSYMAPEQASGDRQLTTAADVYSLGAILYELLTGRPPFKAATPLETVLQVRRREPARPRALNPRVNGDLETICLKCLEKDPTRRYGSAEALAEDLDRWLAGEPIRARAVGRVERSWRWCRRNPAAAGAGILAVVAVVATSALAAGSVFAAQLSQEQERTQTALGIAEQKGAEAEQQRQRAEDQEKLARQYLYGAHILLAQRASETNHVDLMLDYLERHIPTRPEDDVRGWEWHYLWRRAHSELFTFAIGSTSHRVAYSADGTRLFSGEWGQNRETEQVTIWDIPTRRQIGVLKAETPHAFSHDGQSVASGTKTGDIKLWNPATGQVVKTFKAHDNEIRLLAFSPDGKRLASAAIDKRLPSGATVMKSRKVWDLSTGREVVTIQHNLEAGYQWSLVFSPDGTRLASGSRDAVKIWDATTGQEVRSIEGRFGPITDVAFSPDGKRVAAGSQDSVGRVWDVATGQEIFTLKGHTSAIWSVSFSPDGKRLATGCKDATIKIWDMDGGKEIGAFKGHRGDVWSVAYSPDGTRLASGSADKTVKVWDATPQEEGRTIKAHAGFVSAIAFSPDGQRLASAGADSVWDNVKNEWVRKPGADQDVHVWDVTSGRRIQSLQNPGSFLLQLAFSPDGKQLAAAARDGLIRLWDAGTGQEIRSSKETGPVGALAFRPDGRALVFGTRDGIKVIDATTGKELLSSKDGIGMAGGIKFSPDGKRLAASKNAVVNVLDATDGKLLLKLSGHSAYCIGVAFSPDGKLLASGSWDNTAKLWDASTGREILTLKGHTGYVTFVIFSPDGKRLATMSPAPQDMTIKIWDTSTGQELLTLKGRTNYPVFSPDGKMLATGGRDGTIQIWDATPMPAKP